MKELRRCRCGSKVELVEYSSGQASVICRKCSIAIKPLYSSFFKDKESAIKAWNMEE